MRDPIYDYRLLYLFGDSSVLYEYGVRFLSSDARYILGWSGPDPGERSVFSSAPASA